MSVTELPHSTKNLKNFSNLCHLEADYGLEAEWHFFATSHKMSACDGITGTVKREATKKSLQATTGHMLTPIKLYSWATQNMVIIHFV